MEYDETMKNMSTIIVLSDQLTVSLYNKENPMQ